MTGAVSRKIALAKQLEELRRERQERNTSYPAKVRRRELREGEADERIARLDGAIATLEWCQQNEHLIREWVSEVRGKT